LVYVPGTADGYVLTWNAGLAVWESKQPTGGTGGGGAFKVNAFSTVGSDTEFTLSATPDDDIVLMVLDGIPQDQGQFNVSGTAVTWIGDTLPAGLNVEIYYTSGGGGGGGTPESEISAELTANVNNYAPTGWSTATIVLLDTDGYNYSISGFDGTATSIRKTLANVSSNNITLLNNDTGSSAANRLALPGDIVILPNGAVQLFRDTTNSVWRAV
jgi:hypothetical protein